MIGTYIRVRQGVKNNITGYVLKQGEKFLTVTTYNKGKWSAPKRITYIEVAAGRPVRLPKDPMPYKI